VAIQKVLSGIIPSLVTPFTKDGRLNVKVLRQLVNDLIEANVSGLNPLASTGEIAYLTERERTKVARVVIDEARGCVPVVVGVESTATQLAVDKAKKYQEIGADALLMILRSYLPLSKSSILDHFFCVADAVSCPIVLYNNPRLTGVDLAEDVVIELAQHPNIQYLKDASGLTGHLLSLANLCADSLRIFSGSAHIPLAVLLAGGIGWMGGPVCLVPRESVRLYELVKAGNWEEAIALQRRLWVLNAAFTRYGLAACIKAGLAIQGYPVGIPRPPQQPVPPEGQKELARLLSLVSEEVSCHAKESSSKR